MFRKPKRAVKAKLRTIKRKESDDDDDEHDDNDSTTLQLVEEAKRQTKKLKSADPTLSNTKQQQKQEEEEQNQTTIMHSYQAADKGPISEADLATRTAQHHPARTEKNNDNKTNNDNVNEDGIFRDKTRNKFLAGPIKASAFVRTTCRFDYQPDICKDYKDTGFCGFGDSCIYLHDRGDTLTGWQLEQQWEEQQKKERQERELEAFAGGTLQKAKEQQASGTEEDGLPFACFQCRKHFTDPVVTSCGHYFCETCILNHVRNDEKGACPICGKDTHGVFNQPTKLIAKKRRLLGRNATWKEFAEYFSNDSEEKDEKKGQS